ncbi:disease resistance protein RPP13-like isoform X3 [Carex rostrata]
MAETIVNLVLGKLADVLVSEVLHLYSVNDQVEKVSRELKRIQAFLKDADRKPIKDERQIHWVKEVRDIAHSIEDVIDTFLMKIPQNPQKSCLCAAIKNMLRNPKNLSAVHNLVNEINQILEKMREIEESRVRYGINNLREGMTGDIKLPIRPTVLPDIDPDIVGFKADQDRVVKELLVETTKRRSVVSICGTGGLGKTTLAQKVYNCDDVVKQFKVRIWVAISDKFKVIDVSRKIAQQLKLGDQPNEIEVILAEIYKKLGDQPNETEVILAEIYKSLGGKKYLIVLDDVWTTDLWTQISAAFPDKNNGSRVLMTTRIADVPKGMDPNSEPYMLKCLTKELSRELLLKIIFSNHDPNKISIDDLSDVLDQFVHMCGGLPLALVVLGGLLSKKPRTYAAWSSMSRTMRWHDVEGINLHEIIGTSYEHLSFAQKSCFMYFAAFPEDYTIDATSLLRMWIAEGFIPQEDNRTLEETAESFLEDLIQRSMVQVDSRSYVGSIKTLRIHDLLRDLALQKAKEENFLLVYTNPDDKMSLSRARRVAIHNLDCDQLLMSPNLRTLLCFYKGSIPNCSKQRLLKVVSIREKEENIIELGMFMGLTQLRYLSLAGRVSDNYDQEFFEKVIGRMKFLQTFEVRWLKTIGGNYFEFPRSAWNIKTLRHVYDTYLELPASTKLTNLKIIGEVMPTQSWEIELPHIPNLRSLQLYARSSTSNLVVPFLSTLEHLTNLDIIHDDSVLDILDMRGFLFYNHLQSLSLELSYPSTTKLTQMLHEDMLPCHLIDLKIEDYKFQQDIMPVLEKLRCLKVLILHKAFESRKTTCSSRGFSQLEVLELYSLSMEEWEIEEGAMPILKKLHIYRCDKLGVPQGLQYLTNLQNLEWGYVDDSKADFVCNLCPHVPSFDLKYW